MNGIEQLKRRTDALAPAAGQVVLIYQDPVQLQALSETWSTWKEDTRGMTPEQIIGDPRYRQYEQRHYAALAAGERARGNIPVMLDSEDRDL